MHPVAHPAPIGSGDVVDLLKRVHCLTISRGQYKLFSFLDLADDADQTLFNSMLKNSIVSQVILPEVKTSSLHLRQKGRMFDLPRCTLEIHKISFCHGVCLNSFNCF